MLGELAEDWLELWRDTWWPLRILLLVCTPTYVIAWFLADFFGPQL